MLKAVISLLLLRRLGLPLLAAVAAALPNAASSAQTGISPWAGPEAGRVRLIAGSAQKDGSLSAGVEVKLAPGWKTYWRAPGDSGIPPEFDWSGSGNVESVKIHWPAPGRFKDDFGENAGYKSGIVFPLKITRQENTAPVELRVKVNFGICEKICVPAEARLELTIPAQGESANQPKLDAAMTRVPAAKVPGLSIISAKPKSDDGRVYVRVRINAVDAAPIAAFVEGPASYYISVPQAVQSEDGALTFDALVEGADTAQALVGKKFTITAVQGKRALEQILILE